MNLFAQLKQLQRVVINLFFPPRCLGCQKEGEFLCASCRQALPRLLAPFCPKCGYPFSVEEHCSNCERWKLEIDGIRSPFRFESVVRQAIHQFKYRNLRALASPLTELLGDYLKMNPLPVEVLVPVPLHPRRLRERGYNQAALLARELGKLTGLPVAERTLRRVIDTPAQARISAAGVRRSNVEKAFACGDSLLQGKQVILIDDVCTTGATLNSCAIALKETEAKSVWGLTLAREV